MNRPYRCVIALCAVALIFVSAGCGTQTATVAGRVTYKGKPVTNGSVIVYCSDRQIVRGSLGQDGAYSIPNVPYGSSAVTVQSHARVPAGLRLPQSLPPSSDGPLPPTVGARDEGLVALPDRYALPEESGLTVVVDRATVDFDITLTEQRP